MSGVRPRILLIVRPRNHFGGVQSVVSGLATHLPATGFDVRTVVSGESGSGLAGRLRRAGLEVDERHEVGSGTWPTRLRALRRTVRDHRPSLVCWHYPGPSFPALDALAVRQHGAEFVPSLHSGLPPPAAGVRARLAARLCGAVAVTSADHAALLVDVGMPLDRVKVLLCGVEPPSVPVERSAARQRLRLPHDAFVVVCAARLVPNKGVDVLIEALGRIPDPDARTHLVVAGEGGRRRALEMAASVRLRDRAIFTGYREDLNDVYAAADVCAVPSLLEALPLVLHEAALRGVPSVASVVGGVRTAVLDGETGLVVPPGDVDALAAALTRLMNDADLTARLGRAARDRARREFTAVRMAERYAECFREVLGMPGGAP